MRLIRLQHGQTPILWKFIEKNLPPSLIASRYDDGYGYVLGIELNQNSLGGRLRSMFSFFTQSIATIGGGHGTQEYIELRQPQYFSDIEALIAKYEEQTGNCVEFRYWEAA